MVRGIARCARAVAYRCRVSEPVTPARRRKGGTKTSAFGVGKREGHDSSAFYERFHAPEVSDDETIGEPSLLDTIVVGDARNMSHVADNSVALVVTSPPYFAGKAYEEALGEGHIPANYVEYLQMLEDVFAECVRVLQPGGRIAVNVANLGRRPYRSLAADVTTILQDDLRLLLRGEVVWVKQRGAAGNCAWGSFQRPGNPVLRDLSERVIIASKGRFDRAIDAKQRAKRGLPSVSTMSRDEFSLRKVGLVWDAAGMVDLFGRELLPGETVGDVPGRCLRHLLGKFAAAKALDAFPVRVVRRAV
jgi:site-specific DNA-methyltransferase (adenine-specific)